MVCSRSLLLIAAVCVATIPHDSSLADLEKYDCSLNSAANPRTCEVPYNSTLLVLSYQLDDTDGYWIQGDESGPYIDSRLPICRQPNCTVNINRTLTNDDSGWYYYVTSANPTNKQTPYVIVKVLAPPKITGKVIRCEGDNSCANLYVRFVQGKGGFNITVEYDGIGPFYVKWYFRDQPFQNCFQNKMCKTNSTGSNKQTLTMMDDIPLKVNGTYSAVVYNRHGSNSTTIYAFYDCTGHKPSQPGKIEKSSKILYEGSTLDYFCKTSIVGEVELYACYVRDKHRSFNETIYSKDWKSHCAIIYHPSTQTVNGSNGITVKEKAYGTCDQFTQLHFSKEQVSVGDSGMIYCAYHLGENGAVTHFATLDLTVEKVPLNKLSYILPLSLAPVLILIVVVTLVFSYKIYKLKRSKSDLEDRIKKKDERRERRREQLESQSEVSAPLSSNRRRSAQTASDEGTHLLAEQAAQSESDDGSSSPYGSLDHVHDPGTDCPPVFEDHLVSENELQSVIVT